LAGFFQRYFSREKLVSLLVHRPLCWLLGLRAITRDELASNPVWKASTFGTPETVALGDALTVGEPPRAIRERFAPLEATLSAPFVAEVEDAELCGSRAIGFASRGRLVMETTTPLYSRRGHVAANVSRPCLRAHLRGRAGLPEVAAACSLHNDWSSNYYHWIIDSLTRLEAVEHYQRITGVRPKIVIRASPSRMQRDSLQLMGYGPEDCLLWDQPRMRVRKLVVAPLRRQFENGVYNVASARALRWVSDRIQSNLPEAGETAQAPAERIYISRSLAATRRVTNEEEVVAALEPLGFRSYNLETLSFAEQVRLFSRAWIVLGPHGAGMTNLIFGRKLTVIEFFGPDCPRCYAVKSRALGFRYGYLRFPAAKGDLRGQDADFAVDVPMAVGFVRRLLEEGGGA
jgi:hypothetical protein